MSLPYELRFLNHPKGQVGCALGVIITLLLTLGTIIAMLPESASSMKQTDAIKLFVRSSIPQIKTNTNYHTDFKNGDGIKPNQYGAHLKEPTALLIYYSEVTRHAEFFRLLKKARFTAAVAGVSLRQFDCSSAKAACDKDYGSAKLEKSAKDPTLLYYQEEEEDDDHKFKLPADLSQPGALTSLERWLKDGPGSHRKRKAARDKKREEEMAKYKDSGHGMGHGYPGGMPGGYGGYGYGGEKMEL